MHSVTFTANARLLGSRQVGATQDHSHLLPAERNIQGAGGAVSRNADNYGAISTGGMSTGGGFTETRPVNAAYHPRIHA